MKSLHIYVVEDMAVTRATLINVLQNNGHTITGSGATSEKAWLELQEKVPEIVLLDFNLKGTKNGLWLAEKIKNQLQIPFIFITAYGSDEFLEKITEIGADGFIMKPFNKRSLLATIQLAVTNFKKKENNNLSKNHYILKTKKGLQKIVIDNIRYLQSNGNYVTLFLDNDEIITRNKLDTLLATFNSQKLKKTHLRYAVHIDKISFADKNILYIEDVEIPISKSYSVQIRELFQK